jgi:hypothetical protein
MARKHKAVTYDGDLAKPIRNISDDASAKREWMRRFKLLYTVFNINPTNPIAGLQLAIELAAHHVPGLQFDLKPGPGGRKVKWDEQREAELALAVDALKKDGRASTDKEACRQLMSGSQSRKWGKPQKYSGTGDNWLAQLQNRVPKGRKTFVYKLSTMPPTVRELVESFFPRDTAPLEPDENGSYLGALLKPLIT